MKPLSVVASCLLLLGSAFAASSPAEFTKVYVKLLQQAAPGLTIRVVRELELKVTDAEKNDHTMFLQNAYDAYKQSPENGHAIIQQYVNASRDFEASKGLRPECIVPIIKDRAWLQEIRASLQGRADKDAKLDQVWEAYNDELVVVYAEDTPQNVRYFSSDDLTKIGLARADLRALAVENLRAVLPRIELHGSSSLYMMTAGGNYEASLLLLENIWYGDQVKVEGDIVVAIPARDILLITGSRHAEGLAKLRTKAAEIAKSAPYRLTLELFVFRDGKFVRFER